MIDCTSKLKTILFFAVRMKGLSQLIPITLALLTSSADALSWSLTGCSAGTFSDRNVDIECSGSSSCSLGDTAVASGTVYASDSFDDEEVTLNACVGSYCPGQAEIGAGSLCSEWLTPADGQSCGEKGNYDVYYEEKIPDESNIPSGLVSFVSQMVTIRMTLGDCSSSGYQLAYGMAGLVSVAIVGAALMKKKDVEIENSFVQMGDRAAIV